MKTKRRNAKSGDPVQTVASAVKQFGISLEGCMRLVKMGDDDIHGDAIPEPTVRSYIREKGVDPDSLTPTHYALAAEEIGRRKREHRQRMHEGNQQPGARVAVVVTGDADLDPDLNADHVYWKNRQRIRTERPSREAEDDEAETRQMSNVFKVTKEAGLKLLQELGFNAKVYNAERVQKKLSTLNDAIGEDDIEKVKDPASRKLAKSVIAAVEKGDTVQIVDAETAEPKKAKPAAKPEAKPAKKGEAKPEPEDEEADDEDDEEEKPAKKKAAAKSDAKPAAKSDAKPAAKKVGVVSVITDVLLKATEKKPVTKDDIVEVLTKKFPERDPKAMASTVGSQFSELKKLKGHDVRKSDKGWWIQPAK